MLAPAGGLEAGYAAIHYGADAVYLGLPMFSARAEAANYSLDDVAAITGYAHSLKVRRKIYVTVNTLVQEDELDALVEALSAVAAIGVDAVIVQDLGVYRIVRSHFPELRLHASTQLAIHDRPGVEMARELGFTRVTLARELTLEELAEIAALPGIETEVFVHGALCYSYSGLCLFSSHLMGRSGNRGRCAYLCRDQYSQGDESKFFFSMKDLALPEFLPRLRRAGVTALKIEGRMKSPLYVAAAVKYYRSLLDGALAAEKAKALTADIQTIFSRPWTNLFMANRWNRDVIEPDFVGHRGYAVGRVEEIVTLASGEVRLRFHSSQPLEVHDGIQLNVPGLPRPYGFAVERLRVLDGPGGTRTGLVFEAPAGALVEVALPGDHPEIMDNAVVYCASSQEIKRRYRFEKPKPLQFRPRLPVKFEICIQAEIVQATATLLLAAPAENIAVTVEVPGAFQAARDVDQMRLAVEQTFGKLGATRFAADKLNVDNPQSLFVPVSMLNNLRRQATDLLETRYQESLSARTAAIKAVLSIMPEPTLPSAPVPPTAIRWRLKTDQPSVFDAFEDEDWQNVDEVVLDVSPDAPDLFEASLRRVAERCAQMRVRLALPVIVRRWEQHSLQAAIRRLLGAGWRHWQVSNLGAWGLLRATGLEGEGVQLDVSVDWPIYTLNSMAAEQALAMGATRLTLSPEDDGENMRRLLALLGEKADVIVYQDTPLMISEVCVLPATGCDRRGTCRSGEQLASSFKERVRVINRRCRMTIIQEKPFCLASHLPALISAGARSLRADFLYREYAADQARQVWRRLRAGQPLPGTHSGNYERGLK